MPNYCSIITYHSAEKWIRTVKKYTTTESSAAAVTATATATAAATGMN